MKWPLILLAALVLAAVMILLVKSAGLPGHGQDSLAAYGKLEQAGTGTRSEKTLAFVAWTAVGVALLVSAFMLETGLAAALLFFVGLPFLLGATFSAVPHVPAMTVYFILTVALFIVGMAGSLAMEGRLRFWERGGPRTRPKRPAPRQPSVRRRR